MFPSWGNHSYYRSAMGGFVKCQINDFFPLQLGLIVLSTLFLAVCVQCLPILSENLVRPSQVFFLFWYYAWVIVLLEDTSRLLYLCLIAWDVALIYLPLHHFLYFTFLGFCDVYQIVALNSLNNSRFSVRFTPVELKGLKVKTPSNTRTPYFDNFRRI